MFLLLDLTDFGTIDRLVESAGPVDIPINNAGASQIGPVKEAPASLVRSLFQLNLLGVIYLTQKFLPSMRERRRGTIVNFGSLSGRLGVPFFSIYSATKLGLDGYAKGLRSEVKVSASGSSGVSHGIALGIAPLKHFKEDSPYLGMIFEILRIRAWISSRVPGTEVVATKVLKILGKRNPRFSYVVGGLSPLLALLYKVLPEKTAEFIQRKMFSIDR